MRYEHKKHGVSPHFTHIGTTSVVTRPPQEVPENRGGIFCMGAQTRTDILPYMSLIPVFGYFMRGTSSVAGSYQNLRAQISLVVGPLQWSPFL